MTTEPSTVVYTCITGGYDALRPPTEIDPRLRYVAFVTGAHPDAGVWELRHVDVDDRLGPVKTARRIKVLAHEVLSEFDRSVWIDGNVDVHGDALAPFQRWPDEPLLAFRHPKRRCTYDEGRAVLALGKEAREVVERQLGRYRAEGYPSGRGMIESNVLLRDHRDPDVRRLMERWWWEIEHGSARDQLSFDYSAWATGVAYATMGETHSRGASDVFRMRSGHARRRTWRERARRLIAKLRDPSL
jgi:hypothetical protein